MKKKTEPKENTLNSYIEYLKYRLKHEESGFIRKYIRAKINLILGKPVKKVSLK